jgi:predicted lipoprotein with Yx(FWY)xxD motif
MKRLRIAAASLTLALTLVAGCASDRVVAPGEMRGGVMTDWYSHKTLYTFDRDTANPPVSNCTGECLVRWPPFRPNASDRARGDWSVFKRADGSLQWAYLGKPVYTFAGDQKTGDKTGDGVNGVWRAIK